ncbi:hypothetical protein BOC55_35165 [Burkholderia pseudomallei]|nr:hypothetical protein BOC54_36840 [Burkholderia pseudomallei]ARL84172.1 hypothetical protein BOC55_35165 [Burkholderia pseudomallei]
MPATLTPIASMSVSKGSGSGIDRFGLFRLGASRFGGSSLRFGVPFELGRLLTRLASVLFGARLLVDLFPFGLDPGNICHRIDAAMALGG